MKKVAEMGLWTLSWPIMIELFMSFSINSIDGYFFSLISDNAVAAFGGLWAIFSVTIFTFEMIANASGSIASQYIGGEKQEKVIPTYMIGLTVMAVLSALVCINLPIFKNEVVTLIGLEGETKQYAITYLGIIAPALFLQHFRFSYASIVASQGKTKWNMITGVITNLSNLLLNSIFVLGLFGFPEMGVSGIAYATVISQAFGLGTLIFIVHFPMKMRFQWKQCVRNFKEILTAILKIALPSSLDPIIFSSTQVVVIMMIASLGDVSLAARSYAFGLLIFCIIWNFGIAIGTQILTSHHVGGKQFEPADKQLKISLVYGLIGTFITMTTLYGFIDFFMSFFTQNREIVALVREIIVISIFLEFGRMANLIVGFSLRSAGDATFPNLVALVVMPGITIPVGWFLGLHLGYGLVGIWIGMAADECIRGTVNYLRWTKRYWEKTGVMVQNEKKK